MQIIERRLQDSRWKDDQILLRIIVGIDHVGWHSPFLVVHWLIPLAPAVSNINLAQLLSIFKESQLFVYNLSRVTLRKFIRIANIRLDDIEFDNSLIPSFWCQPVILGQAIFINFNHRCHFLLHISLGFWRELLTGIPETNSLIKGTLGQIKCRFFLVLSLRSP